MLKSLLLEYGPAWTFNRALYAAKLKLLNAIPQAEEIFEKDVSVSRVDIFDDVIDFSGEYQFLKRLPEIEQKAITESAEKAAQGVIMAFSSVELDYGNPIDWLKSPLTGFSIDANKPWYQIPDFSEQAGDIKVFWEISRFTHFLLLARASLLTGDKFYYQAYSDQLKSWVERNEYGRGPNYKCGQEASLRMLNALMAYSAFKYQGLATKGDEENTAKIVNGSYKKILSNFFYAQKCIRNNHTLSEACGMFVGAWCCEDERAMNEALGYYEEAIAFQFRKDGGYTQWSFNYQRFALQITELMILVLRSQGIDLSPEAKGRIIHSVWLLWQAQDRLTGQLPNYGSNDGALVFPLSQCEYRDYTPTLHALFCLLEEASPYSQRGVFAEEAIWFGIDTDMRLDKTRMPIAFYDAGLYMLNSGDMKLMVVLTDYRHNRPGHSDQLHVDLWLNGVNVLCDSGTYSYASEIGQSFASVEGHNTVSIPGIDQIKVKPPFFSYDWPHQKKIEYVPGECFQGSSSVRGKYVHTRRIQVIEDGFLIGDAIDGHGLSEYEVLFHTKGRVRMNGSKALIVSGTKRVVELVFSAEGLINLESSEVQLSDKYLQLNSGTVITARYSVAAKCVTHLHMLPEMSGVTE